MAPVNEEWEKVVEKVRPAVEGLKGNWEALQEVLDAGAGASSAAAGQEVVKEYEENWRKIVGCMREVQAAKEEYKVLSEALRRDAADQQEELQKEKAKVAEKEKTLEERTKSFETALREDLQQRFQAKFELEVQKVRAEKSTPKEQEMDKKIEKVDAMLDKLNAVGARIESAEADKEQTRTEMLAAQLQLSEQAHTTAQTQAGNWRLGFSELRSQLEKASANINELKASNGRLEEEKAQLQTQLREANIRLDEGRRVREAEQLKARAEEAEVQLEAIAQERTGTAPWKRLHEAEAQLEVLKQPLVVNGLGPSIKAIIETSFREQLDRVLEMEREQKRNEEAGGEEDEDEEPPRKRRRTGKEPEPHHRRDDGDDDGSDGSRGGGTATGGGALEGEIQVNETTLSNAAEPPQSDSPNNGEGSSRQHEGQDESMVVSEEDEEDANAVQNVSAQQQQQQQPDDFGEVPQALKEALGQVEFPAAFDKKAFAAALKDAASKGVKNKKAKMPRDWTERFAWSVSPQGKVYCLLGKIGACHRGYTVAGGSRSGCMCHKGLDDGFCVRLATGTQKTWRLVEM